MRPLAWYDLFIFAAGMVVGVLLLALAIEGLRRVRFAPRRQPRRPRPPEPKDNHDGNLD